MDILLKLLSQHPLNTLVAFLIVGAIGAISHYVKKYFTGEIAGNLFTYVFLSNPRRSALAAFTFFGSACTAWLSGTLDHLQPDALVSMAFLAGYTIDSALNKGDKPAAPVPAQ